MQVSRYRGRPRRVDPTLEAYLQQFAATNTNELSRLKRNLLRAMQEEVTERQRLVLGMYYAEGLSVNEIAERLNVYPSTVARTRKRGEAKLRRCLRYGAATLLETTDD